MCTEQTFLTKEETPMMNQRVPRSKYICRSAAAFVTRLDSTDWNLIIRSTWYRARLKGGPQVWRILFQLLLTTSAWPCLLHSRNLGPGLFAKPCTYRPRHPLARSLSLYAFDKQNRNRLSKYYSGGGLNFPPWSIYNLRAVRP